MSTREIITVMLVDDHPVVRSGLAGMIRSEPDMEVIAEARDGRQAIELYLQARPRVTLMDLYLPELSGVEAIEAIRAADPQARIVVLTTYDGDENIHKALEAGALSYLLKDSFGEEILTAIRRASLGQKMISPGVARQLASRLPGNELTPKELKVLQLIARGCSNREIGAEMGITEATVKSHVNAILGKLGVADRTQAALAALQRGFVSLA